MSEITSICFYSSGDWLFFVSSYSVSSYVASNVSLKLYIPFVFLPDKCCALTQEGGPTFCSKVVMMITSDLIKQ